MWAHQHLGVQPDIICFGKKTQICGIAVSTRVDEVPDNVFHTASRINSTWGGNLVDMVRSTRYLEIIHEDGLVDNARVQGEFLLERIAGFTQKYPGLLSNPRGRGMFAAFTVRDHKSRNELLRRCREDKGVIALPCGPVSIRFRPPLDINRAALEDGTRPDGGSDHGVPRAKSGNPFAVKSFQEAVPASFFIGRLPILLRNLRFEARDSRSRSRARSRRSPVTRHHEPTDDEHEWEGFPA